MAFQRPPKWLQQLVPMKNISQGSRNLLFVLLVCGVIGFILGIFPNATWHAGVEGGQYLANPQDYPPGHIAYYVVVKSWNVLYQVVAVLLKLGFSEWRISVLISGVLGMLSFVGLSAIGFSITRNKWIAIAVPFVAYAHRHLNFTGVSYPIFIIGFPETMGVLGLSFATVIIGLLSAGRLRIAGFLLGFSFAPHAPWGAWCNGVVLLSLLWDFKNFKKNSLKILPTYLIGLTVSAVSLAISMSRVTDFNSLIALLDPSIPKLSQDNLFKLFILHWDSHRWPFALSHSRIVPVWYSIVLCGFFLSFYKKELPKTGEFLLRILFVSGICGLIATLIHNQLYAYLLRPDSKVYSIHKIVLGGMVTRFLNLNILTLEPLALCLAWIFRRSFAAFLPLGVMLMFVKDAQYNNFTPFTFFIAAVFVLGFFYLKSRNIFSKKQLKLLQTLSQTSVLLLLLIDLRVVWIKAKPDITGWFNSQERAKHWAQQTHKYDVASNLPPKSLMVTATGFNLVAEITKIPLIWKTDCINFVGYIPEAAQLGYEILFNIFGMDLLKSSLDVEENGRLFHRTIIDAWSSRSKKRWQELRKRYSITHLLVHSNTTLKLPLVRHSDEIRVYEIPKN